MGHIFILLKFSIIAELLEGEVWIFKQGGCHIGKCCVFTPGHRINTVLLES